MGTNYYFKYSTPLNNEETEIHIGKRSAAGLFCWDCGLSLSSQGNHAVHKGKHAFLKKCAVCGKKPVIETLNESAVGRELGFNKSEYKPKTGVASCSSFSFAMTLDRFEHLNSTGKFYIQDEYGRKINNFSSILSECPIKFFHSIGKEFS